MRKVILFFVIVLVSTSCDDFSNAIKVEHGQTTQTFWADETQASETFTFKTTNAWTSIIREPAYCSSVVPDWISINPGSGEVAGEYSINISLEENKTGVKRTALITLVCDESTVTINITQEATKKDGTAMSTKFEESLAAYDEAYENTAQLFRQLDNNYATLESRSTLTAQTTELYEFWINAYITIGYLNILIDDVENQHQMSEVEKNTLKAKCFGYRGTTYFLLTTFFGDVPVAMSSEQEYTMLNKSASSEVLNASISDLQRAIYLYPQFTPSHYFSALLIASYQKNYQIAYNFSKQLIESGNVAIRDTNNDGIINALDNNTFAIQTLCLAAESCLQVGKSLEAIGHVNSIYTAYGQPTLSFGSTIEEIRIAIRNIIKNNNDNGLKIINAIRWGDTSTWEKYALFPIPLKAMKNNTQLTQNQGW